jgi:predicted Zn-dependent protease
MIDALREEIEREYVVERTGWVGERAARVTEHLQQHLPVDQRLESLVVWWSEHGAFTTFGRSIYISRRLFERLPDDDAAAFVIAHELAHHRLGHIPKYVASGLLPARVVLALLEHLVCGSRREADADKLAIELCMSAGYDPERCVAALEILSLVSFDYGDVNGVLGGDRRSHPPLADRIAAVRAHAEGVRSGARLDVQQAIAVDRRRRRRQIWTAVGAASAMAALLVLRRSPR